MPTADPTSSSPGREFDAWIEQNVYKFSCEIPSFNVIDPATKVARDPRPFSSDVNLAREMARRTPTRGIETFDLKLDGWRALVHAADPDGRVWEGFGQTEAHAICNAAINRHLGKPAAAY